MCAWQEFKYRMLLLRAADCGKNSFTLHQSVTPENEPAHKWTAFCISRSLLHSRIHVTYIVVNRYMHLRLHCGVDVTMVANEMNKFGEIFPIHRR
jgi:hypothetical protein